MREEEALAFSPISISTLVLLEKSYLAINYVKIRKYYLKSLVFSITLIPQHYYKLNFLST